MIRAFYQRMLAAGKTRKVALTACMRKLLVIPVDLIPHRQLDFSAARGRKDEKFER